jgi:two-component system chemotaxis sensor kinase CheA
LPLDLSRYLDLYVAESREHLAAAREITVRLPEGGEAAVLELYRHAHSLKGMAAAMGHARVADVAHAAEDLLDAVRRGGERAADAAPDLQGALGCIARMVERVARGEPADDPEADRCARRLRDRAPRPSGPERAHPSFGPPAPPARPSARTWRMDLFLEEGATDARTLTALLSALGHLGTVTTATAPSTLLGTPRLMVLLRSGSTREALAAGLAKLPGVRSFVVRPDPERSLAQAGGPVAGRVARVPALALEALATAAQELLLEETHLSTAKRRRLLGRLHAQATELRLEPFDTVAHRIVEAGRQVADSLGRRVRIVLEGGDLRLERSLLDALAEPLLHLMRNAVDHGIEPPEERARAGKAPEGLVRLRLESARGETRITLEDDGRGLDPAALRAAAVRLGASSAEEAARLTDGEARALITRPGFTTATHPGPVSGRGIGMDVVRAAAEALGGALELEGREGGGTRVILGLPTSLAARPVLLFRAGREAMALPLECVASVEGAAGGRPILRILRDDRREALLPVDEILGRREIVIQPLHAAARAPGYSGAALLEDGEIALLLDADALPR